MALKIIFMGTPDFAVPILDSINKSKHNESTTYINNEIKHNKTKLNLIVSFFDILDIYMLLFY